MRASRRALAVWSVAVVATSCLALAGRGRLGTPPIWHPALLGRWWSGRSPVVAIVAIDRLALLGAGCYLVVVLTASLAGSGAARLSSSPRGLTRSRRPVSLRLVLGLAGASAAGPVFNTLTAAPAVADPVAPGPAPVMHYLGPNEMPALHHRRMSLPLRPDRPLPSRPARTATPSTTPPQPAARRAGWERGAMATPRTGRRVTPAPSRNRPVDAATGQRAAPSPNAARTWSGLERPAVSASATPAAAPGPSGTFWTVRPGDDLWSIAEETLAAAWGTDPSTRHTATYWLSVIVINRSRLPNPADPSLLFAGDVVRLPPVPSSPSTLERSD